MINYEDILEDVASIIYTEILNSDKELASQFADDLNQEAFLSFFEAQSKNPNATKEEILEAIRTTLNEYMDKFGYKNATPSGLIKPKDNVAITFEDSVIDSIDNNNKKRV